MTTSLPSKDRDYVDLSDQLGWPPKLIRVRIRNAPTEMIESALRRAYEQLLDFGRSDEGVFDLT